MIDYTGLIEASVITPTLIIGIVAGALGIEDMAFDDLPKWSAVVSSPFFVSTILGILELWYSVILLIIGFLLLIYFLMWVSRIISIERKKHVKILTLSP